MTKREYEEYWKTEIQTKWFRDHRAEILLEDPGSGTTIIEWKRSDTWCYGMRFILHSQWLTIVGDLDEAVHQWSGTLTKEFVGNLNYDYFSGKRRASPHGREFTTFDRDVGMTGLAAWLKEEQEGGYRIPDCVRREFPYTKEEWHDVIREAVEDGYDSGSASIMYELPMVPDVGAIAHWVGITMAVEQLAERSAAK